MSEMVERMLRAMSEVYDAHDVAQRSDGLWQVYGPDDAAGEPCFSSPDQDEAFDFLWRKVTRAGIAAMREPTEAMCQAAFDDGWVPMVTGHEDFARWYRAMIDAALK